MKSLGIAVLAIPFLTGCAGSHVYEQTSMKLDDGTRHYFIKTNFKFFQASRDLATRTLTTRANEICPKGYILVDEQTPVLLNAGGLDVGDKELTWQIKCKTAEQPAS